ncbi:MAG TPA: right-handed parallel beta-helix repeat-containing protein [Candidatus Monoglobus merdigallinarum]|uniref:Right-handed parallel beta-helix repeat-containing protein n=1 Tax=Candidatus Monoglobus merdigallinarum TaxID=2838698 RepID=A0A9D1PPB8_9FIRM|nr:right-handed parallel beta-helix repeat-containing protein [Candidatus Monoglobus merdigallinarum]
MKTKFKITALLLIASLMLSPFVYSEGETYPPDSVMNVSDLPVGDIVSDTEFGNFTIISATDGLTAVTVDSNSKQSPVTGIKYSKRLKLAGTGSTLNRAVKFTAAGPATLFIEGCSANKNETRTGVVVNAEGETIGENSFSSGMENKQYDIPAAGDYWFYSLNSGINIYYIRLTYEPQPVYNFEDMDGIVTEPMDVIYTAPMAPADGAGTEAEPMSIASALLNIAPGGTIYCSGRYEFEKCLLIDAANCGEPEKEKRIECSEGTVFDFSGEPYSNDVGTNQRGVQINGSYWHIKGLEVCMAADNGFFIAGKHNTLELCVANANRDSGIQISRRAATVSSYDEWPSDNLILNCTSYNNFDPATGENADGFAAKLTCGDNNVFDGCIAYNNCDDGWDCFTKSATGPIGTLVLRNCIAFRSGQTTDGKFTDNSDGNGFKMGGSKIAATHYLYNCIAFENKNHGFTDNSNPGPIYLTNCTAYNNALDGGSNKSNFDFARDKERSNNTLINCLSYAPNAIGADKFIGSVKNSVLYSKDKKNYYYFDDLNNVSWDSKPGTVLPTEEISSVDDSVFVSVESPELGADVHTLWRNADGSINMGGFLKVADGTAYKQMGIGADLSDYSTAVPTAPPVQTNPPQPTQTPDTDIPDYIIYAAPDDFNESVIDIRLENNTETAASPCIMLAAYTDTEAGSLLTSYAFFERGIGAGSYDEFSYDLSGVDYNKVKVMVWDSTDRLTPLANCAVITPAEPEENN